MKHFSVRTTFASLALVAALAVVPAAKASPIFALGTLSGASAQGTGTITSNSFTAATFTTASSATGAFTGLAGTFISPALVTFATNGGGAFNFSTASIPTINSTSSSAISGGTLFMSESYNGINLNFFVTAVYHDVVGCDACGAGGSGVTGNLWLLGYLTDDQGGLYATTPNVSLQITNSSTGAGPEAYSFKLASPAVGSVTPEPNSLVLLGTGLFCIAGFLFYRRNSIA